MTTTHLQGIGLHSAKPAGDLKVGDRIVYNYGYTSTVTALEPSPTGKTLIATTEYEGKAYTRRYSATRLVAVASPR